MTDEFEIRIVNEEEQERFKQSQLEVAKAKRVIADPGKLRRLLQMLEAVFDPVSLADVSLDKGKQILAEERLDWETYISIRYKKLFCNRDTTVTDALGVPVRVDEAIAKLAPLDLLIFFLIKDPSKRPNQVQMGVLEQLNRDIATVTLGINLQATDIPKILTAHKERMRLVFKQPGYEEQVNTLRTAAGEDIHEVKAIRALCELDQKAALRGFGANQALLNLFKLYKDRASKQAGKKINTSKEVNYQALVEQIEKIMYFVAEMALNPTDYQQLIKLDSE
jgi:hypothetical protein